MRIVLERTERLLLRQGEVAQLHIDVGARRSPAVGLGA